MQKRAHETGRGHLKRGANFIVVKGEREGERTRTARSTASRHSGNNNTSRAIHIYNAGPNGQPPRGRQTKPTSQPLEYLRWIKNNNKTPTVKLGIQPYRYVLEERFIKCPLRRNIFSFHRFAAFVFTRVNAARGRISLSSQHTMYRLLKNLLDSCQKTKQNIISVFQ